MSEEIRLTTEHILCTTEDAFEEFQANSMYQEEQFITLSDIVSPEPQPPQLSSEFSEIPYDNEVVLSSNLGEHLLDYGSGLGDINNSQTSSAAVSASVNNVNDACTESTVNQKSDQNVQVTSETKPKRARKRKRIAKNEKFEQNEINDFPVDRKSKRERKRKQSHVAQNESTISENVNEPSELHTSKRGRKRNSNKISLDLPLETPSSADNVAGKHHECADSLNNSAELDQSIQDISNSTHIEDAQNQTVTEDDNILGESLSNAENISLNKSPKKGTGKRGRPKKKKLDHSTESISSTSNGQDTVPTKTNKRGRPKKQTQIEIELEPIQQPNEDFNDQVCGREEELDDLPLTNFSRKNSSKVESTDLEIKVETTNLQNGIDNCNDNTEDNLSLSELKHQPNHDIGVALKQTSDSIDIEIEVPPIDGKADTIENCLDGSTNTETEKQTPTENENHSLEESLLVEDPNKRPRRRKAKKTFLFDDESDEDPFANMGSSSDDEPKAKRKGTKYYSDDEYVPREKKYSSSDSEIEEIMEEEFKPKRKRPSKSTQNKSPKKPTKQVDGNIINVTTIEPSIDLEKDDIEECLQSSVIKSNEDLSSKLGWSANNEFESFIAKKIQGTNIQIKKVSSNECSQNTPLDIPVLDADAQKSVESSTQTNSVSLKTTGIQTSVSNELTMKTNVALTAEQSEKACEFLKSIVKTTAELGQLMTDKSQDFILKKINTDHVVDTFKMDYCVNKTFLLLKLAKHNIFQMEDDLTKQYEEFLKSNNLSQHLAEQKIIAPTEKDNDSDCEIVEEISQPKPAAKPKFNPKTVFLNKELSIKIAKKPTVKPETSKATKTKINMKNKSTVWINNSIMVKKVKPTQSFLAQDSRNKKPPDCYVTEKMVSDFFIDYNRKLAQSVCAPFTSAEWLTINESIACNHFIVKAATSGSYSENNVPCSENNENASTDEDYPIVVDHERISNPESLFCLCTEAIKKNINAGFVKINDNLHPDYDTHKTQKKSPSALFRLCVNVLNQKSKHTSHSNIFLENANYKVTKTVMSLKSICYKNIAELFYRPLLEKCIQNNNNLEQFQNENDFEGTLEQSKVEILNEACEQDGTEDVSDGSETLDDLLNSFIENTDLSEKDIYSYPLIESKALGQCNSTNLKAQMPTGNMFKSLFSLCVEIIQAKKKQDYSETFCGVNKGLENFEEKFMCEDISMQTGNNSTGQTIKLHIKIPTKNKVKSLSYLCLEILQAESSETLDDLINSLENFEEKSILCEYGTMQTKNNFTDQRIKPHIKIPKINKVRSLSCLCLEILQECQKEGKDSLEKSSSDTTTKSLFAPSTLTYLSLEYIKDLLHMRKQLHVDLINENLTTPSVVYKVKRLADICFEIISAYTAEDSDSNEMSVGMTINEVNTMTEEAFHNLEENNTEEEVANFYEDDNFDSNFGDYEEAAEPEDNNWVSQLQMQELRSCFLSNDVITDKDVPNGSGEMPVLSRIKIEPGDESEQHVVDSTIVKKEPIHHFDGMTMIPDGIITKHEHVDNLDENSDTRRNNYDVEALESFKRRSKVEHLEEEEPNEDGFFSQSGLRVRRQHVPDYNNEYDPSMSLLIPQTFEPVNVETAKGSLMESSSSDENENKKAPAGKKRGRKPKKSKKPEPVKQQTKDPAIKEKGKLGPVPDLTEVAVLTRRMREKIRQEEKKIQSLDSEKELPRKKDKELKEKDKPTTSQSNKDPEDEIQCNNVDSTEQVDIDSIDSGKKFTGFTAVDQNEITSYHKYVKYVYDQIVPKEGNDKNKDAGNKITPEISKENVDVNNQKKPTEFGNSGEMAFEKEIATDNADDRSNSPLIDYDDPVEMLQCEPTMPIFDDDDTNVIKKTRRKKDKNEPDATNGKLQAKETLKEDKPTPIYRHGWECYPIDAKESKLYLKAQIILEKLPESFVETYFKYQEVTGISAEDKEVDRLINLNSLNRSLSKDVKRSKGKSKSGVDGLSGKSSDTSRVPSPGYDSNDTLTASEDDEANVDDELPPPVPRPSCENNMAKSSLMDDSDEEHSKVNKEIDDDTVDPKRKSKRKDFIEDHQESLMLTADKSMNKELNLLHAPVVLSNECPVKETKAPLLRNKHKSSSKGHSSKDRARNDEDSSSEEEKQWVTTKEKLLKRLGKKHETAVADDAKRAKLVSEFIERREVQSSEVQKRELKKTRRQRNSRKRLEREKQMRVLSHELLGEPMDPAMMGPRHAQVSSSYFKGRRNIRKVIDKKSLQRSTVIANMEEFERKRRLNQQQAALRELLGYEEGVSVLVINDEVCLEYGFQEQRPLVTVHPFFTKVMKAHQYEGVKFMWDACFESLEQVEAGQAGGGCILAHCMGLGKTLQVLALLHTVLTHPRVGMQRVLVCCPLSTVLNWVDEIHKWIGPVTNQIKVFELSKLKKTYERAYQLEDWYNEGGIFIIGYELFRSLSTLDPDLDDIRPTIVNKIRSALLDPGPDIVVCDEGHLLKNDCSVLAIAMSRVATKRRIVLTGTPMQNNLREYYCMVNFVKPNLLGTYSEFSNRFENPIMNGQHRDSVDEDIKLMKQRTHILHKVLEGCLQRQEVSVLYPYLPKKHEYTLFISLTSVQWDLYKHYVQNYCGHNQTKQSILKDFHILQKIWSHPQVLHNFQMKSRDGDDSGKKLKEEKIEDDLAREDLASEDIKVAATETWWLQYLDGGNKLVSLDSSNKFVVVFRILEECVALGDKVLIFSTSLITLDALEYFLKKINKWSLGTDYYRLDGSVPAEVRQKWCREFNAEHNYVTKLFLISTRAGCLGLNMVAANRVILFDTSWNPAHDIQSIFRVYRFGQKKDCYIYRLVALGTMEQKIYERSVTKQAVACRVVDEQQIDRHYNMQELTDLYRYDESGAGVVGGVAVGVCDVALLRVARLAALHAVHEHDSLLRGSSELALPEHERLAAWVQFQQEHANKQMQDHLTSHLSIYAAAERGETIPEPPPLTPLQKPQIKTETASDSNQDASMVRKRKKKGARDSPEPNIDQPAPDPPPLDEDAEEAMVQKIMELLIQHNFQGQPDEISQLVTNVRKMVATGKVARGLDKDLAKSIAAVLLTNDKPEESNGVKKKGRGRPRKMTHAVKHDVPENQLSGPSTSKAVLPAKLEPANVIGAGRRRAAINAENKLNNLNLPIVELGDDWQDDDSHEHITADEDWQDRRIEAGKTGKKSLEKKDKEVEKKPEVPLTCDESILLSDDDEPLQNISNKNSSNIQTEEIRPQSETDKIPLHPSLLSNKNFIKIVAHTYLDGNPLLDEDAAMLAAQYTALRAKKDVELNGQPIVSGPIYDIAVNILGIDILKKLHLANPGTKDDSALLVQQPKKAEPPKEVASKRTVEPAKVVGPKLKPKKTSDLMHLPDVKPPVVPVGLIKRAGSMANESILPQEESILPDDSPSPRPAAPITIKSSNIFRHVAKPLVINAITASQPKVVPTPPQTTNRPPIPKLIISAGKLLPQSSLPPQITTSQKTVAKAAEVQGDTICLDSDDDEIGPAEIIRPAPSPAPESLHLAPSPAPETPRRRVALKSTAKPAKQTPIAPKPVSLTSARSTGPVPVSLARAASGPVPVSLTAVNPHNMQPHVIQEVPTAVLQTGQPAPTVPLNIDLDGKKYLMIPSSQINHISALPTMNPTLPAYQGFGPAISTGAMPQPPRILNQPTSYINLTQPQPIPTSLVNNMGQSVYGMPQPQIPSVSQPDSILSTTTKTVCKPGDILRITSSGSVEILNREDEAQQEPTTKGRQSKPGPARSTSPVPIAPKPAPTSSTSKEPEPERRMSLSSTSSSDSSRPNSPDDPLSILKDVVHIQAPEDTPTKTLKTYKRNDHKLIGNTSISKSTGLKKVEPVSVKKAAANPVKNTTMNKIITPSKNVITPSKNAPPAKSKAPISQDAILKHISKTDTILKKLDKVLSTAGPASRKAAVKPSSKPAEPLMIDLDDYESTQTSSKASQSKQSTASKVYPAKVLKKVTSDNTSALKAKPSTSQSKTTQKTGVKESSTKVSGTSKNIIIGLRGNTPMLTTTDSSGTKTSVRVTNVEKLGLGIDKRADVKKRAAPAPADSSTSKKKKTGPMTLKDFNLDDIDDIIELE